MMLSIKHLFMYLSSLVKCPCKSFAHFLSGLVIFLLLSYKNSLYILEPSPLSDIWVENIFCQSVVWIFIFLIMSFEGKIFSILIKSNSSIFSFKDYVLGVKSKKSLPNPRSGRFFSFFQKFYRRIKLEIKKKIRNSSKTKTKTQRIPWWSSS